MPRPLSVSVVLAATLLAAGLLAAPRSGGAQERPVAPNDEAPPAWALSIEFLEGFSAVYGAWRRVAPGVDGGVELQTTWSETRDEVDRLDNPGTLDAFSDRDVFTFTVGPSVRWRVLSGGDLSPVLRVHGGYVRTRVTVTDASGDFERTADGALVRFSAGVDYRVSRHMDVILSLGGRWSVIEGDVLFHANETVRTTDLELLVPAATFVVRF
ncbi:MAG: hypothetical protein GWM92_19320 [Gemmatimonadetes bacterium]|nr:porin family protein [Gemmatimonadota bacterium]NIR80954.1 porin family protein [Gemmatimonadota bacterium]NIT89772.1 porin family protein [Gemmatimonadota bacterium]NIU33558.1 porin family protein [Gemmatimonadota bacterium]NIU37827.1 hypothetical protein [Gemmatimonadota bacterium]